MERGILVAEARAAGENAVHNLKIIRKRPEVMLSGKVEDAEAYLNNMIRIAKSEIKNDRRLGQSSLRNRLRNLIASILTPKREKSKEDAA